MSEPVIKTCSGMAPGAACAICACAVCCCACATTMLVSVRNDADPIRVAIRDAVGFIVSPPVWAQFSAPLSCQGIDDSPRHRQGELRKHSPRQWEKLMPGG